MPERTQLRVVLVKAGGSPFSQQSVQKFNEPLLINSRLSQSSGSARGGNTDVPRVTITQEPYAPRDSHQARNQGRAKGAHDHSFHAVAPGQHHQQHGQQGRRNDGGCLITPTRLLVAPGG